MIVNGDKCTRYQEGFCNKGDSFGPGTHGFGEVEMAEFLTQFINGISIGSMYAMVAIGYTLFIGVLNMLNFAHIQAHFIDDALVLQKRRP